MQSNWGLGFQHLDFGGTHTFSPQQAHTYRDIYLISLTVMEIPSPEERQSRGGTRDHHLLPYPLSRKAEEGSPSLLKSGPPTETVLVTVFVTHAVYKYLSVSVNMIL